MRINVCFFEENGSDFTMAITPVQVVFVLCVSGLNCLSSY